MLILMNCSINATPLQILLKNFAEHGSWDNGWFQSTE